MDSMNSIRSRNLGIRLRDDEYALLDADVKEFGVSLADALRRRCPEFFVETEVKKGRRAGSSPWKRS